jgi:hypothetical protein
MWDGKRGFWLVSLAPPSQFEWNSKVVTSGEIDMARVYRATLNSKGSTHCKPL